MSIFNLFHSKNYLKAVDEEAKQPRRAGVNPTAKKVLNKRKYDRHDSLFATNIRHHTHKQRATVINYSETGLGMLVDKPMSLNDSIELELQALGCRPIMVKANIKRCYRLNNKFMVGAHIETTDGKFGTVFRQLDVYGPQLSG